MTAAMRAAVIYRHGGPEVLELVDVDRPEPGPGEVLIRVRAVSVNSFLDVANRAGKVPFARYSFPHILGSEHAGEVAGYGPDTARSLAVGTPVVVHNAVSCGSCKLCVEGRPESCLHVELIGVMRPGTYADYAVVPEANVRAIPSSMSFVDAAAMSLNGPLATLQLVDARARAGDAVLIQGAASATGTMAAVVARAMGLRVLGTTRSPDKLAELDRSSLFDGLYDSTRADAAESIRAASGGGGVDVVIDNIGSPDVWSLSMEALAPRGRVVTSGAMFGGVVPLDLPKLYRLSQQVIGVRSANDDSRQRFWSMVVEHDLRPVIDSVFVLAEVADAHRRLEAMANIGRVVVTVD